LLENDFRLHLVNAQFLKQLSGHKSDVKDAEWIATVLLKELVCDSFVPDNMKFFSTVATLVSWVGLRPSIACPQTMECGGLFVKSLYLCGSIPNFAKFT